jgi:ADP-ribosylglycohydrolase
MVRVANASEDQFLGALLGLGIGDALGMPLRNRSHDQIMAEHGQVQGYLPGVRPDSVAIGPGEFTDETEITLCIIESLTANGGVIDVDNIGARVAYLANGDSKAWMGDATRSALQAAADSLDFRVPLDEDAPATGDVASRGVAIGLLHAIGEHDASALRDDAEAVTRLTHGSPAAITATTAVAQAVRLAARGESPRDRWAADVADLLGAGELAERLRLTCELLQSGTPVGEVITRLGTGDAAIESVPAAFAAASAAESFEAAVVTAVNAGGATDTIAGIAGAIAGAAGGVNEIPQRLIDDLEGRIYLSLAAPWFFRAVLLRSGQIIDLRRREPPRPSMPPRV